MPSKEAITHGDSLKGKGIKPGLLEISLGVARQCLRDGVLARSFSLSSQWR